MARSLKKGPYVDERILKKVLDKQPGDKSPIKVWNRACTISPEMVGFNFEIYNGRKFIPLYVIEDMVGHKFGEFAPTRTFLTHGGKMQKELEQAAKQRSLEAAKAAKAAK